MASTKEIQKHLKKALDEIGKVTPRFDAKVDAWVFKHPLYPVEYGGSSAEEVQQNYPLYLKEFITERLNDNLNPLVEKKTKGTGGKPTPSRKPKPVLRERKERIEVPGDLARWLQNPHNIDKVRLLKNSSKKFKL